MKTIAIATALIAAISAPAFAGGQLEKNLGVAPGVYSASQLAVLKAAGEQTGAEARVYFGEAGNLALSTSNNPVAADVVAGFYDGGDDTGWFRNSGPRTVFIGDHSPVDRAEGPNS